MARLLVRGGRRLDGEVRVSGSRNAALPLLASSLLGGGASTFTNVPDVEDVRAMARVLGGMGAALESLDGPAPAHRWRIATDAVDRPEVPYEAVRALPASVLLLGPLLARFGRARVAMPGASLVGASSIEEHLRGLERMGASFELQHGDLVGRARRLRGAPLALEAPSVTATATLMMAATLAEGRTQLDNAARDPEIEELARVLNKRGARIQGAGTASITVDGVDELFAVEHGLVPDRHEAGTWLVAGALAGGSVRVARARPEHLDAVLSKLRHAGVTVAADADGLRVEGGGAELQPIDLSTAPYPGFPSDMQAQLMVLAARARGQSVITETIVPHRSAHGWAHAAELRRLGADIHVDGHTAIVRGPARLQGARVQAWDPRASVSLVLAALVADGETQVDGAELIERGYEGFAGKLAGLGADVEPVAS